VHDSNASNIQFVVQLQAVLHARIRAQALRLADQPRAIEIYRPGIDDMRGKEIV
jgi:hypothetical protein